MKGGREGERRKGDGRGGGKEGKVGQRDRLKNVRLDNWRIMIIETKY